MAEPVQIARDPFARSSTMRETVETEETCSWCGRARPSGKLFRYSTEKDAIRPRRAVHRGLFCSRSCERAYNS